MPPSSNQGNIAIQFVSKAGGNGLGQLRITTDESTAENGSGTIYIYDLRWTVPEPGTIMVFGAITKSGFSRTII